MFEFMCVYCSSNTRMILFGMCLKFEAGALVSNSGFLENVEIYIDIQTFVGMWKMSPECMLNKDISIGTKILQTICLFGNIEIKRTIETKLHEFIWIRAHSDNESRVHSKIISISLT